MLQRLLDRLLRDLVERQPVDLPLLAPELLGEVPADRLAFAIGVGRDVDVGGILGRVLELLDDLLARLRSISYSSAKSLSTSTPSLLFGRSRMWPIDATTL